MDFHVYDGIYQGSRSHVLGIFAEAIQLAPQFDFIFFLANPEQLRNEYSVFNASNVQLISMPCRPGLVRLAWQLPWLRWRHKIDLLHTQYRIPPVALGPCACTMHDVLFESHPEYFGKAFTFQSKVSFRFSARKAKLLFSVSEFSKSQIVDHYGVTAERISVIYNGVDRQRFYPGDEGEDVLRKYGLQAGNYLLTVGRLEPRKNHANLFRAYARLPDTTPPLMVVGQKDFGHDGLPDLVKKLGLGKRVRFLESVPDLDLPAIMRNATIFLFPSYAEGFGMPVLEAMASGVPVVTSNTTALIEVADNGAELIYPADAASIEKAILRILLNPEWKATLLQRACKNLDRFGWMKSAGILVAAYEKHFLFQHAAHEF